MKQLNNHKNPQRKFALYIGLGIEVNNLLLSGLATKLQTIGLVEFLTRYDSAVLDKELKAYDFKKYVLDDFKLMEQTRNKIEGYFLSSRRARLRLKGLKTFSLLNETPNLRLKDYLIGNIVIYKVFKLLTFNINRRHYINEQLALYMQKNKFTDLVIQSYSSIDKMTVLLTAQSIGCNIWIMNWGWKDFFINEFIPVTPDGFFTWNGELKKLYHQFNRHIPLRNIHALGNPSYDHIYEYKQIRSLDYYAKKYKFPASKKIILYTLVNPDVYLNEPDIIKLILSEVEKSELEDIIFLLKPNPMDKQLERFNGLLEYENVYMLDNLWEYDRVNNFNMMTSEARDEYYDLLSYSLLTMNIPSTVTIESLIMKKPVINISFDGKNKLCNELKRLAESAYYKSCLKRDDVILAWNKNQVVINIMRVLNQEITVSEKLTAYIIPNNHAVADIVNVIGMKDSHEKSKNEKDNI